MNFVRLPKAVLIIVSLFPVFVAAGTLCSADEDAVFSCEAKRKVYEICASKNLSATSGYMQYRAGVNGKVEFIYPVQRVTPAGKFRFTLLARGAQLSFRNDGFVYEIIEPLIGAPSIWISREGGAASLSVFECRKHSVALILTTTQERFKSLGIYE